MSFFSSLFGSREKTNPAPSSSDSKAIVIGDAKRWVDSNPLNRRFAVVNPTGSMLPYFDSFSVLLEEKVTGYELVPGDIASYDDLKGGTICHRVREVNARGAVLFTGDNNRNTSPDGWIAPSRIRWRVAGILYSKRT